MINEGQYYRWSLPFVESVERISIKQLSYVRMFANRAIERPYTLTTYERALFARMQNDMALFGREMRKFSDNTIAEAYIRALESTDARFKRSGFDTRQSPIPNRQIFAGNVQAPASPKAVEILTKAGYSTHLGYIGAFQQAVIGEVAKMQFTMLSQLGAQFREIQILAASDQFLQADTLTRRGFTQIILNRMADQGIEAVRYADGRMVTSEAYAEMLARTTLGNSFNQATVNRAAELGNDLVRMSVHERSSPMCEPWQGGIYSSTGNSEKYTPLDTAIGGGAFHPNCKHSIAPYFEGISPSLPKGNESEGYKEEQQQRYNERQIRKWKRRETVAQDDTERIKSKAKVNEWQSRQREFIKNNDYLRRNYAREQIN